MRGEVGPGKNCSFLVRFRISLIPGRTFERCGRTDAVRGSNPAAKILSPSAIPRKTSVVPGLRQPFQRLTKKRGGKL